MLNIKIPTPVHKFSSNTYIISSGNECAVIDPSVPYDPAMCDGELKYILLTHSHFDHILDIESWVKSGAEVIISEHEVDFLGDPEKNCYALFFAQDKSYTGDARGVSDGEIIPFGDDDIEVIAVPGHTVGSLIYKIGNILFVGDTVFAGGGFGRWDLPSGNFLKLKESIVKIIKYPDDTFLYPGHGDKTTVKEYKQDYRRL